MQRGKYAHRERAKQLIDVSGLLCGDNNTITPTDFDYFGQFKFIEYQNEAFIFYEYKYMDAPSKWGQKIAFERLTDIIEGAGYPTIYIVASHNQHNPTLDVNGATAKVREFRLGENWYSPEPEIIVKKLQDIFLQAIDNKQKPLNTICNTINVTRMVEKKKSWADVEGFRKRQEEAKMKEEMTLTPEQVEEIEKYRMAVDAAPLVMQETLKLILTELRFANEQAFGLSATKPEEEPEVVYERVEPPEEIAETMEPDYPPEPDLTTPSNLEEEDSIVEFYKDEFRKIKTRGGDGHSDEDIEKTNFMFQEDDIKVTFPGLSTPLFAATARYIEDQLGGQYVGGKGAHFLLPYP